MVDFVHKRLQIFVSSTFTDLKQERQAAVEAILTAGHIPAGMELFTAGSESQWEVIKQWIDESDIYMLILGGRYGSIEPVSGKSYTQLEYEYAVSKDKTLFACVVNEAAQKQRVKDFGIEFSEENEPKLLRAFRAVASSKMVRFWDDFKDIKIAVIESISHLSRGEGMRGWVRETTSIDSVALANEIARLSEENARLRELAQANRNTEEIMKNGLTPSEVRTLLQEKNILNEFINAETNKHFIGGAAILAKLSEKCFRALTELGLITGGHSGNARLSDDGRLFINKRKLSSLLPNKAD